MRYVGRRNRRKFVSKTHNTITRVLWNLHKIDVRGMQLGVIPYGVYTEADLQALLFKELIEKKAFAFSDDVPWGPVGLLHLEFPSKGTKRGENWRRNHDIAILDPWALRPKHEDKFQHSHILAAIELKYAWDAPFWYIRQRFNNMIRSLKDTKRIDKSFERGYCVFLHVMDSDETGSNRLKQKNLLKLKAQFSKQTRYGIFCYYLEIQDGIPRRHWLHKK